MIEVAGAGNRRAAGNVADELEIRNVLTRIAHCSDTGELADYAALFTEDARWEMPGVPVKQSRAEISSSTVTSDLAACSACPLKVASLSHLDIKMVFYIESNFSSMSVVYRCSLWRGSSSSRSNRPWPPRSAPGISATWALG